MDRLIRLSVAVFLVLFGASSFAGSGKGDSAASGDRAVDPVSSQQNGSMSGQAGISVNDVLGDQDKDQLQTQSQDQLHQDPDQLQDRDQLKDQDKVSDQDKDKIQDQDRVHQNTQ